MAVESKRVERVFRSTAPEATEALGESLGRSVASGTVIALEGELGAGKTCFVRGLARGLGIADGVASPTYTLMQAFEGGRLPLYHFDAWMEGREKALFADGGDEWLHAGGVAVIEWAGRVADWLPEDRISLVFTHLGVEERRIVLSAPGAQGALGALIRDLSPPPGLEEEVRMPDLG